MILLKSQFVLLLAKEEMNEMIRRVSLMVIIVSSGFLFFVVPPALARPAASRARFSFFLFVG